MKKQILALFATLVVVGRTQAVTISVADSSGALSQPLLSDGGAGLANGSALIRIGYFTGFVTNPVGVEQTAAKATLVTALSSGVQATVYAAVNNNFVPLGEGLDSDLGPIPAAGSQARLAQRTISGVSQPGRLIGGVSGVNPNTDPEATRANPITGVPAGTRIFILAYNALDPNNATEMGIYSATSWLMPASAAATLQLNTTVVDTPGEILMGRNGSLHLGAFVPEPSAGIMGLLAGLGLIVRRRRR